MKINQLLKINQYYNKVCLVINLWKDSKELKLGIKELENHLKYYIDIINIV